MANEASKPNNPVEDSSGSRDRATVALVDAKVGIVDAKVDGIHLLLREFKEDVKALGASVGEVLKHGVTLEDHERRINRLENEGDTRPARIVAVIALLIAVSAILVPLLAGAYHH